MLGSFQIQNCSVALTVMMLLSQRDGFEVNTIKVKNVLKHAMFPGRMQKLKINNKTVIIDGAHNPQKMAMFIKILHFICPNKSSPSCSHSRKAKIIRASYNILFPSLKR